VGLHRRSGSRASIPNPLINDAWDVVFFAHVADQGSGLFIKNLGRDPLIIGDTLMTFSRFHGVPDINSRSEVAFYAEIDPRIPPGPINEDQRPKSPDPKAANANPAPAPPRMGTLRERAARHLGRGGHDAAPSARWSPW
jgi:hypothetical protein